MTKHIWISDEVCDQLNEYIEVFFDVDKLSSEDLLDIQNEIVLAGLNEVITRRMMEREMEDYAKHDLEGLDVKREVKE